MIWVVHEHFGCLSALNIARLCKTQYHLVVGDFCDKFPVKDPKWFLIPSDSWHQVTLNTNIPGRKQWIDHVLLLFSNKYKEKAKVQSVYKLHFFLSIFIKPGCRCESRERPTWHLYFSLVQRFTVNVSLAILIFHYLKSCFLSFDIIKGHFYMKCIFNSHNTLIQSMHYGN